jgi:transposase
LFELILHKAENEGRLDWELHQVDSTIMRAHQHAAGAAKSSATQEALGRSQGGFSTKIHRRASGEGKPVSLILTPGQQHESTVFKELMLQPKIKRLGGGGVHWRPRRVAGDKAYSSQQIRAWLKAHGIGAVISWRRNEKKQSRLNKILYRERNQVERLINHLKQFWRLATRYEKCAENYRAMWLIGFSLLWL